MDTLIALMEHPALVSASNSLKSIQERKISASQLSSSEGMEHSKLVYIFQREFATVNPTLVNVSLCLSLFPISCTMLKMHSLLALTLRHKMYCYSNTPIPVHFIDQMHIDHNFV